MKKTLRTLAFIMSLLFATGVFATNSGNNSVYIDQTNADNSTVSITQTGSGNAVGDRASLLQPAFVIDGNAMSLTIVQDGMNNSIVGNFIGGVQEFAKHPLERLDPKQMLKISKEEFDRLIETSPNIGMFWTAGYRQTISPDNIIKERAIICICYKWADEEQVHS